MTQNDNRMSRFEQRLDSMGEDISILKADVRVLKDDVRGLRVLYEHHDQQIRTVAEVQAHHGRQLEQHGRLLLEIRQELIPMRALHDFVRRIADEHDRRLSALEKHTGIQ